MGLLGHFWTIAPNLRHRARPWRPPPTEPWSTTLRDPALGDVTLHGALHHAAGEPSREVVVLVHGLGGAIDSHYIVRAAQAAAAAGVDALRLGLRGSDRSGEDLYHAALTADLEAAVASPALAAYARVYVLGFSLGGHLTLAYALGPGDPRVVAVASVCAPLDLRAGCAAIDRPRAAVYRGHVLASLKDNYAAMAARRPVPTPWSTVRRVTTIRAWDRVAVVPRHGFVSVDDYYARASVGPRLRELKVPALVLSARGDPMVPAFTNAPHVGALPGHVVHRFVDQGGHVAFPGGLDLGLAPARGLEAQVLAWLRRQ